MIAELEVTTAAQRERVEALQKEADQWADDSYAMAQARSGSTCSTPGDRLRRDGSSCSAACDAAVDDQRRGQFGLVRARPAIGAAGSAAAR